MGEQHSHNYHKALAH